MYGESDIIMVKKELEDILDDLQLSCKKMDNLAKVMVDSIKDLDNYFHTSGSRESIYKVNDLSASVLSSINSLVCICNSFPSFVTYEKVNSFISHQMGDYSNE